jgi:hypothetical protein
VYGQIALLPHQLSIKGLQNAVRSVTEGSPHDIHIIMQS